MAEPDLLTKALTKPAKFGSLWAEVAGWATVVSLCASFAVFGPSESYWMWKSQPDLAWIGMMMGGMTMCVLVPFVLVGGPIAIWKRKFAPTFVRVVQVFLPFAVVFFALGSATQSADRNEDFSVFRQHREEVALKLKADFPKITEYAERLPISESDLAASNRVYVYRKEGEFKVFFPTILMGIDNFSGFVYSETGLEPPPRSFLEVRHVERLDKNWFWIRTT